MSVKPNVLPELMRVIKERKAHPSPDSYTCKLLQGGLPSIGAKVREEAEEVIEAASEENDDGRTHVAAEAADLLYHLMVLLAYRDLELADVEEVLAGRFGISGIEEKASRKQSP